MLNTVLGILLIVMAVFLVVTILLQSSKDHRMSGTIAGGAETFFGKQKGKTVDGILNKITAVVCVLFFLSVLAMYVTNDSSTNVVPDNNNIVNSGVDNDSDADNTDNDIDINGENNNENNEDTDGNADTDADNDTNADNDANTDANADADADTVANGDNTDGTDAE